MNAVANSMTERFRVGSRKYKAEYRSDRGWAAAYVFEKSDDSTAELEALATSLGASTIHTKVGDFPELDAAWKAFNRAIVIRQKAIVAAAMEVHGLPAITPSFSRKRGCKCGCSPGFNLKPLSGFTLYITEVK